MFSFSNCRSYIFWLVCLISFGQANRGKGLEPPARSGSPDRPASAEQRIWLSDLPEQDVRVGWGSFGKHGWTGFDSGHISLNGIASPHGLGTHPDSSVTYRLGKKYRTFRATAAVNDSTHGFGHPVLFRIEADGKQIWESRGLQNAHACQSVALDVSGVDRLTLKTIYDPHHDGNGNWAHVVWLEPYVSAAAPDAEMIRAFDPRKFTQPDERQALGGRVRDLLYRDKFAELEDLAKENFAKHDILDGFPRMHCFYDAMTRPFLPGDQEQLETLGHLEQWHKARPRSATPHIAAAQILLDLARSVREGGTRPPGDEGWRIINERVSRAGAYVGGALQLDSKDPELYGPYIELVAVQDWPSEKIDGLLDDAMKLDPHCSTAYLSRAATLLPRRGGKPGDLGRLASAIRKRLGGHEGDVAYAQIALVALRDDAKRYGGAELKTVDLRPALIAYCREFAASRPLVRYACRLACLAGDFETARAIFDQIPPGDFESMIWSSANEMEDWRSKVNAHPAQVP